jgi:NADP-dependent 3-hydroxy acid dehydrogenase YdfG
MHSFKEHVAVITGGGSGIGRAISLALSERGATVCLVGRRAQVLESVATTVRSSGGLARTYSTDITSDQEVGVLAERVEQELGRVDILVHSAGTFVMGELSDSSVLDLDSQYRANVRAPFLLTQVLLPLLGSSRGQIVFINSSVGLTTRPNVGQFSATQHALKAFADTLRDEVNAKGIRVLSVYPGRTATPRQAAIFKSENRLYNPERLMQPGDVAAVVINALALSRTAEVTDIKIRPFLKFD